MPIGMKDSILLCDCVASVIFLRRCYLSVGQSGRRRRALIKTDRMDHGMIKINKALAQPLLSCAPAGFSLGSFSCAPPQSGMSFIGYVSKQIFLRKSDKLLVLIRDTVIFQAPLGTKSTVDRSLVLAAGPARARVSL